MIGFRTMVAAAAGAAIFAAFAPTALASGAVKGDTVITSSRMEYDYSR